MADAPDKSREQRLAEQLRANLRRRKAQSRALAEQASETLRADPLAGRDSPG